MPRTSKTAVLPGALRVGKSAAAQTNETITTKTTTTQKSGVVETVYGHHVVLRDADGTHKWIVPEDLQFQMHGQNLTVAHLKPGMKVDATTTKETTIHDVSVTRNVTGQVMQVAPGTLGGGIVVKDSTGKLTSYGRQDMQGRDVTIVRKGRVVPLSQLRAGDNLEATIVTTFPPQVVTMESTSATVKFPDAGDGAGPVEPAPTPAPEPGGN
jgi:hypothetical protein